MDFDCSKKGFDSKADAEQRLREIAGMQAVALHRSGRRSARWNIPRRSYLCPNCGKWHLTHEEYILSKDRQDQGIKLESEFEKYLKQDDGD